MTRRSARRRRRFCAVLFAVGLLGLVVWLVVGGRSGGQPTGGVIGPPPAPEAARLPVGLGDLFGYRPGDDAAYAARAAAGAAQALFVKSPGGVVATAARVAAFGGLIDAAVRGTNIPSDLLEGLVFVESAGRPEVIAGPSAADAAGLTQILAGTGVSLLGMRIDLPVSAALTRRIDAALDRGDVRAAARLEAERARVDARFDPSAELRATVRYLRLAEADLGGRADLAVAAYHAGIGNMQHLLGSYDGGRAVSFEALYFGTSPAARPEAWSFLSGLGDDSADYLWRVLEAERIMALYRSDRGALQRLAIDETSYPSNALALLDAPGVVHFASPRALSSAYRSRRLVPLPRDPGRFGVRYSSAIGLLADRLGAPRALYAGLRPAATLILEAMAGEVRRLAPGSTPLVLDCAVVDGRYQSLSGVVDPPFTTGYTFDIAERYGSSAEADAFQFALDRLQALDLIAWTPVGDDIEVTVAPDAERYLAGYGRS